VFLRGSHNGLDHGDDYDQHRISGADHRHGSGDGEARWGSTRAQLRGGDGSRKRSKAVDVGGIIANDHADAWGRDGRTGVEPAEQRSLRSGAARGGGARAHTGGHAGSSSSGQSSGSARAWIGGDVCAGEGRKMRHGKTRGCCRGAGAPACGEEERRGTTSVDMRGRRSRGEGERRPTAVGSSVRKGREGARSRRRWLDGGAVEPERAS
jgi:hypothetical protein